MSDRHGLTVVIGSKPRCAGCGHRQEVNGTPPKATRELVLAAGPVGGIAVAFTELRDRRRAKRVGKWMGLRPVDAEAAA